MSNQQKISRAVRDLAQAPFDFWRINYADRVVRDMRVPRGEYLNNLGVIKVVIVGNQALRGVTLRVERPYSAAPSIGLYKEEQQIARYSDKLKPVAVLADLGDDETNTVEAFASEVRRRLRSN